MAGPPLGIPQVIPQVISVNREQGSVKVLWGYRLFFEGGSMMGLGEFGQMAVFRLFSEWDAEVLGSG